MEVGDAHRHQHLRLCEVHGSLFPPTAARRASVYAERVPRLGLIFVAMASTPVRAAPSWAERSTARNAGLLRAEQVFPRSDPASTPDGCRNDRRGPARLIGSHAQSCLGAQ